MAFGAPLLATLRQGCVCQPQSRLWVRQCYLHCRDAGQRQFQYPQFSQVCHSQATVIVQVWGSWSLILATWPSTAFPQKAVFSMKHQSWEEMSMSGFLLARARSNLLWPQRLQGQPQVQVAGKKPATMAAAVAPAAVAASERG
mmetsp:Transcript_11959/g.26391  ORF Transcript_11959/g.26391 Transcript_11959/m.26391 type:complete len:143 (-) Transcript_11959:1080-1508(-)